MSEPIVKTHIAGNADGTYDAFVKDKGFLANSTLAQCTRFIREQTGCAQGTVSFLDRSTRQWDSEIDIAEGA